RAAAAAGEIRRLERRAGAGRDAARSLRERSDRLGCLIFARSAFPVHHCGLPAESAFPQNVSKRTLAGIDPRADLLVRGDECRFISPTDTARVSASTEQAGIDRIGLGAGQ